MQRNSDSRNPIELKLYRDYSFKFKSYCWVKDTNHLLRYSLRARDSIPARPLNVAQTRAPSSLTFYLSKARTGWNESEESFLVRFLFFIALLSSRTVSAVGCLSERKLNRALNEQILYTIFDVFKPYFLVRLFVTKIFEDHRYRSKYFYVCPVSDKCATLLY